MRQVGILAAAALYAVQNNRERLKEDHWRAKHLAERIKLNTNLDINMEAVQTNILLFNLYDDTKRRIEVQKRIDTYSGNN
jgi:threonine aldolase